MKFNNGHKTGLNFFILSHFLFQNLLAATTYPRKYGPAYAIEHSGVDYIVMGDLITVDYPTEVTPSTLVDSKNYESLQSIFGQDWKYKVDTEPEVFEAYLPTNWKETVGFDSSMSRGITTFLDQESKELTQVDKLKSAPIYSVAQPSSLVSEANAERLKKQFGTNWKKVVDQAPENFESYIGANWKVASGEILPEGREIASNEAAKEDSSSAQDSKASTQGAQPISNVSSTQGQSNVKDSSSVPLSSGSGSSMTNQILSLGTGIVGSNILVSCKMGAATPSINTFFGGSLVYIGAEIMGAKAQKAYLDSSKKNINELKDKMTHGGDLQREIIFSRLRDEEEKLEFVKKRKKWMTAVATIYGASTALAAFEFACSKNPATAAACAKYNFAGCEGASSLPSNNLLSSSVLAAYGYGTGVSGGTKMTALAGLAAGLSSAVNTVNAKVSTLYQTPETRIGTFGAGTLLTGVVIKELNDLENDVRVNITQLRKLLESVDGVQGNAIAAGSINNENNVSKSSTDVERMAAGENVAKQCWGKNGEGLNSYSELNCGQSVNLQKSSFDKTFNAPTLQSVANTGVDMAQAIASGDAGKADLLAGQLAGQASRVREITDNVMKQVNEELSKKGIAPIELSAASNEAIARMSGTMNPNSAGMNMRTTKVDDSDSHVKKDLEEKPRGPKFIQVENNSDILAGALPNLDIMKSPVVDFDDNLDSDNFTEALNILAPKRAIASANEKLGDDINQRDDIILDSSLSLFKQVSNRYILNYDSFFTQKQGNQNKFPNASE